MKRLGMLVLTFFLWGCSAGRGPEQVAHEFWEASRNGDAELARELVLSTSTAEINEPADGEAPIGHFALGDSHVDGGEAMVETTIGGLAGLSTELEFNTVLAREDGEWKVDLDRTSGDMTRALFGTSMQDMAEQMGAAMAETMGGVTEGMAEGMKTLGDSLAAAAKRVKR